jgi:ADP-ribosyl-[dinitrogen reductase] hydrolase
MGELSIQDRYQGAMLGLACGDAVGTAVEFKPRGTFELLTGMRGGGPFGLKPGQWTDDTSMALCLVKSLLERREFDACDQMRRYVEWWRRGYLSSTGRCFDIGITTQDALRRFEVTGEPFSGSESPDTAGNGSLMRLAPVVLCFHPNLELVLRYAAESSRTTHAAPQAVECCRLLAYVLSRGLSGIPKDDLFVGGERYVSVPTVAAIARGEYLSKRKAAIKGSGYSVASLEASLWCVAGTDSFEAAVLTAANLGDDADTTAAITGQIAGTLYGREGIPSEWLEQLYMREEIAAMAEGFVGRR